MPSRKAIAKDTLHDLGWQRLLLQTCHERLNTELTCGGQCRRQQYRPKKQLTENLRPEACQSEQKQIHTTTESDVTKNGKKVTRKQASLGAVTQGME